MNNKQKETMKPIEELTIAEAQQRLSEADELRQVLSGHAPSTPSPAMHPFTGEKVFIRSVTHHYTGRVVEVTADEIVLTEAAWIADDGRFANALANGTLSEVEPFPPDAPVRIGRGAIVEWTLWGHDLPTEQK